MDLSQIFSAIGDAINNVFQWIVDLLPDSPFQSLDISPIKQYLKWINWFIPIDFILKILLLWLSAIAAYYVWSMVLRWIKAID